MGRGVWGGVLGPLEGHTRSVMSVSLSGDGRGLSGSSDKTAGVGRGVWGVRVGSAGGAHDSVWSVSYLGRVAHRVGSEDRPCGWDAVSGECVLGPLKGHTSR